MQRNYYQDQNRMDEVKRKRKRMLQMRDIISAVVELRGMNLCSRLLCYFPQKKICKQTTNFL